MPSTVTLQCDPHQNNPQRRPRRQTPGTEPEVFLPEPPQIAAQRLPKTTSVDSIDSGMSGLTSDDDPIRPHHHDPHQIRFTNNVKDDGHLAEMQELHATTTSSVLVPRMLPISVHFQPLQVIQRRAQETGPFPVAPECLAARLSAFVHEVSDTIRANKVHADLHASLTESIVIEGLHSLGWKVQELHLAPPSSAYQVLDNHTFWVAIPPAGMVIEKGHVRIAKQFILDFRFADLFVVARPTALFQQFLKTVRNDFVGMVPELQAAVQTFAMWAGQSLEEQRLAIPPWRRANFLETCFALALKQPIKDDADFEKPKILLDASTRTQLPPPSPSLAARMSSLNAVGEPAAFGAIMSEISPPSTTTIFPPPQATAINPSSSASRQAIAPSLSWPKQGRCSQRSQADDFNFEKAVPVDSTGPGPSGLSMLFEKWKGYGI